MKQWILSHVDSFVVYHNQYTLVVQNKTLKIWTTIVPCDGEMERSTVFQGDVATLTRPESDYFYILIIIVREA